MPDYEILYLTRDEKLSVIYKTYRRDDGDAVLAATGPAHVGYKSFEIWRGDECVKRGVHPLVPN